FDAVVDLMAKFESAYRYIKPPIPIKIGNGARWFRPIYNRTGYIRRSHALMNEAEYNWRLIRLVHKELFNRPLTLSLDANDFKEIKAYTEFENYVLLMPGVTASAVAWQDHQWINLADRLASDPNLDIVIMIGPAEQETAKLYYEAFQNTSNVHVRSFSEIPEVLGALQGAKFYVGPSTGITHLASALRVPGVALYPIVRSMHPRRWMPFHSSLQVIPMTEELTADKVYSLLTSESLNPGFEENREKISAFIICFNEENNIRAALESIKWCDEIIIVDSGSTDRTLEICREYNAKIYQRAWPGHSAQKLFALGKCSNPWALNIDADEEVSLELRSEIVKILADQKNHPSEIRGYLIPRVVHFLDRWWDKGGWHPEYRLRLFQPQVTSWGGIDPHEKAFINGKTGKLRGHLYHYTYETIEDQIKTLNNHSSISAKSMSRTGRRSCLVNLIFNPLVRFLIFYVFKLGFREGTAGLIMAVNEAFCTFLKYAKLWELQREQDSKEVEEKAQTNAMELEKRTSNLKSSSKTALSNSSIG
ncbi:MAG: glycosyltransferase, partial [Bdellovibrionales bacterium]|nr:glycosyltransferase [Bdellovibrionales bacterium]